ncbi:MAG TPA: 2-oxoglutarate dehydrogenase complex dihydrolipoyllysine-residue succinyltransferase [Steroidobacteraceae bacterium]|nr:2-oxoglutarate dehydrogenase complex dihydrolipoyllysine-residue succinyltransferase [Steroidobacteraceae bacterium]
MSTEIRVPALPESIADATLVAWHKQPGEGFKRDENLADLETDKVVLEVPAPADGVMRELKFQVGATVTAGQVLALIEEGAAAQAVAPKTAAAGAATAAATGAPRAAAPPSKAAAAAAGAPGVAAVPAEATKLSPSVRRLVEENQLNPAAIPASGRDGRLTKSDVVGFLDKKAPAPAPAAAAAAPAAVPAAPVAARAGRAEQRVAMSRLRARVAQRLVEAQSTAALLTTFNEVDLTAVNELRARYKDRFEKVQGVKLGFMAFFVKAAIEALKKFPVLNASVDGTDVLYHEYYDIGVAVSTDRGLMVPVVRDADLKSFADIEKEIAAYAGRARSGTIGIEELTGGTFTITNGGVFGSLLSTPIVNAPQSAILGMHKIQDRPVALNGQVVVRPMMYLAVTYDHRIIDGREAVQFLVSIKDGLEDPGRMLLGV